MDELKRAGVTTVTSVSVSPHFKQLLEENDFSPTEVFRRGMAVMLFDIGVTRYDTPLNHKRNEWALLWLKSHDIDDMKNKITNTIFQLQDQRKEITNSIHKLKDTIDLFDKLKDQLKELDEIKEAEIKK